MNSIKFSKSQSLAKTGVVFLAIFLMMGCATVGKDFPVDKVSGIEIGKTTQQEILLQFGSPWRVGIEDGRTTWTYGKYKYRLIGDTDTTDLVIRFDSQNIVASYSFNTTEHVE